MALTQISTAGVKDDAVTSGKIPANAVGSSELADNAVNTAAIADDAVTAAKIADGTTDLVNDTSPQLGGNLDVNTKNIVFGDSSDGSTDDVLKFGGTTDLKIYHDGTDSYIDNESGYLYLNNDSSAVRIKSGNSWQNGKMAAFYADGAVELYHDNTKRIETTSTGAIVTGELSQLAGTYENASGGYVRVKHDSGKFTCGGGNDCHWYHDGSSGYLENRTGNFYIKANVSDTGIAVNNNGSVQLYNNGFSQLSTETDGVQIRGGDTASETLLRITGNEGRDAEILMSADEGDDTADHWRLRSNSDNSFDLVSYSGGTYKSVFKGTSNHVLELHYQGYKQAETMAKGLLVQGGDTSNETMLRLTGNEGQDAHILFSADEGDDSSDHWRLRNIASTNKFDLVSYATGSYQPVWTATGGSDPNLGIRGALYIQNKNATQRYNTSYTDSVGVGFQPFGTNSLWFTHTYNNGSGANTPGPYHYNLNSSHNGVRFYVKVNGGVVNHSGNNSNLCDERMKTNIVDAPSFYNSIKNIAIKKFNYKSEPEGTPLKVGVIAQQVETIESDLVDDDFAIDGSPNDESTTKMKSVHEEQLFMMGIKALQEAIGKIEILETKVAALEAA